MPYFDHSDQPERRHRRVFQQPVTDEPEEDFDDDMPAEDFHPALDLEDDEGLQEEERLWRRRDRWRLLAGVGDFVGVIVGAVVILVLILLLISLLKWVKSDMLQSFTLLQTKL